MEIGASSAPLEVAVRSEDDDEDPFAHGGALDEREATSEVTIKQEEIPAEAHPSINSSWGAVWYTPLTKPGWYAASRCAGSAEHGHRQRRAH